LSKICEFAVPFKLYQNQVKPPEIKCATSSFFVLIDPDKPLFPEVIEVRFGFQKLSNLN
jgi:hypothetical protein